MQYVGDFVTITVDYYVNFSREILWNFDCLASQSVKQSRLLDGVFSIKSHVVLSGLQKKSLFNLK